MLDRMEELCARLCLLSDIARQKGMPEPMGRRTVRTLVRSGKLDALMHGDSRIDQAQMIRAARLLERAPAAADRIAAYEKQGYTALLDTDAAWPKRLGKLGADMPLYLFARGNTGLLSCASMAVAGSRRICAQTEKKAEQIGRILAKAGVVVVSGGADGVDRIVQYAALQAGGSVIVVPAAPASEILWMPGSRKAMAEGRLLILCETPPDEPFSGRKALTRNHTIYALGDCALVVASRERIGGSWAGARACLQGAWSPVYVLDDEGPDFSGNAALLKLGALRMQIDVGERFDDLLLEGIDGKTLARLKMPGKCSEQMSWEDVIGHAY